MRAQQSYRLRLKIYNIDNTLARLKRLILTMLVTDLYALATLYTLNC